MKAKKRNNSVICWVLCLMLCFSNIFPVFAEKTTEDVKAAQTANVLFEESFDSYETGTINDISKLQEGYLNVTDAEVVDLEEGNKALQIVKGQFELECAQAEKQVEFDFKYDTGYSKWGGIYVKMYNLAGDGGDYYFSLNPQFSKKMIVSYGYNNLADNTQKEMKTETWYRCKAVLEGSTMSVKVWERSAEEPDAWDITYTRDGFSPGDQSTFNFEVNPMNTTTKTLIDNLTIRALEQDASEVQITVSANDSQKGTVSGGGSYAPGKEVTVKAAENPTYKFVNWTEDGKEVSKEKEYTFIAEGARDLVANFAELEEPQYEYFFDDYESYEEGEATKDNMPPKYIRLDEGYSIADLDGNKALKISTIVGNSRYMHLDCDLVDKQVQFDFYYDGNFSGGDGFYVKLHSQPNGSSKDNEYYFSINPNFGNTNLIVSCNTTNLKKTAKSMTKETWYTCKSRIYGNYIMVKIWGRNSEEPKNWDICSELKGFELKAEGTRFKLEYVDRTKTVNGYIDNLSIKTWEKLDEKEVYQVNVKANSDEMGTVEGGGEYLAGNEVLVNAIANEGYRFVNWTDENGVEVSKEATYKFKAERDCVLTANFEETSLTVRSFMADGLTQLAEINEEEKTIKLRFAFDTDLKNVKPAFYYDIDYAPSVQPYETMDLSGGKAEFDGWTILAEQNSLMKEFYVDARRGSDSNSGETANQAFATIERAQQAVREIDSWTGDVMVHIAKGEYVLDETLEFTPEDGAEKGYAVIYKGAGANETIISSGIKLTGWEKSDDVPGVDGVYEIAVPDGVEYSRDLYVGTKRAVMAQEKCNRDLISNRNEYGYVVTGELAEMANWRNPGDIEFSYDVGWTSNILPVKDIQNDNGTVKVIMEPEPFKNSAIKLNCNPNKPTVIQGAFELLDEENEWYFDREAGKIYFIPENGTNPDELNMVLPTLTKLVEVKGEDGNKVHGLSIENMSFRYTSYIRPHIEGQIELQAGFVFDPDMKAKQDHDNYLKTPGSFTVAYAEGMHVNNCVFGMLAASGLDYEIGVTGSTITQNRFEQIGAAGIQIGGVRVRDAQPYSDVTYEQGILNQSAGPDPGRITEDILVFSNVLDTIGNNFKGSIGIFAGYVRDCTIAHNLVTNVAYSGISAGWGWGIWDKGGRADHRYYKFDTPSIQERYVIEYNNINNCMTRLKDGGAIYTLSYMPGSIIRGNFIHDIPNPYGSIYLDEGTGGIVDISENVVYNVYRPYFYHTVAHYQTYRDECEKAKHDNFFTTGAPVESDNPSFIAIKEAAGPMNGMEPPILGEYVEDPQEDTADKIILQMTYDYAVTLSTEDAVSSAVTAFEKALKEAKAVLDDPKATQAEVNTAWDNLLEGIWGLGIVRGDKTNLDLLIQKAESMIKNADKYVTENWQKLVDALKAAKEVYEDGDALKEDIEPAADALLKAILAQRFKANKSNLENMVNQASAIDLSLYTEESAGAFRVALMSARGVLADDTLSVDDQASVDEAAKELEDAIAGLEKESDGDNTDEDGNKEDNSGNKDNTSGGKDNVSNGTSSGNNKTSGNGNHTASPKTGDNSNMIIWLFLMFAAVGAVASAVIVRKRK